MQTTYGQSVAESSHALRAPAPRAAALASERARPVQTPAPAPRSGGHSAGHDSLLSAMVDSKVYREYEQAFTEATGMPMALRPVESWQLPLHGKRHEAPYCALMSQHSRACASCLQMQEGLSRAATQEPHSAVCPSGLCETAVPVHLGEQLIGFLQTGQVFRRTPTQAQFEKVAKAAAQSGIAVDKAEMKEAYFATRVVPQKQFESATVLLKIFAQYLSILSNQVVVQRENAEPPVITRAKKFIEEHQTEELRLADVAKAVNTSTFYFCKMFKKTTGINFTDYVSRVRIEKSKNLLLNPNLRISEIAYEVGFQSLTHFNRVFKRVVGNSPTEYREHLMAAQPA